MFPCVSLRFRKLCGGGTREGWGRWRQGVGVTPLPTKNYEQLLTMEHSNGGPQGPTQLSAGVRMRGAVATQNSNPKYFKLRILSSSHDFAVSGKLCGHKC